MLTLAIKFRCYSIHRVCLPLCIFIAKRYSGKGPKPIQELIRKIPPAPKPLPSVLTKTPPQTEPTSEPKQGFPKAGSNPSHNNVRGIKILPAFKPILDNPSVIWALQQGQAPSSSSTSPSLNDGLHQTPHTRSDSNVNTPVPGIPLTPNT